MKKHNLIMLMAILFITPSIFAQGIEFTHGNWAEVKAKAKQENKLIFVDFFTDWCSPCKAMALGTFPVPAVGDFYNQHFISVKIDAEKGEGIKLARQYNVNAYPTLVFINPGEEVVYKVIGGLNPDELIKHGGVALNPTSEYLHLKEKYAKGELTKEEFSRYLKMMQDTGAGTDPEFELYFLKWPEVSEDMFQKMNSYANKISNKAFKYLEANRDEFSKVAGKEKVDHYVHRMYLDELHYKIFPDETAYRLAKEELKKKITIDEETDLNMDVHYAMQKNDEKIYMKYSGILYDKYYKDDARQIGNMLGPTILIVKDAMLIAVTRQWAERAVALKDDTINNVQLALIYAKGKKMSMAEKYFDIALADSKRDNDGLYKRIEEFKKGGLEGMFFAKKLPTVEN